MQCVFCKVNPDAKNTKATTIAFGSAVCDLHLYKISELYIPMQVPLGNAFMRAEKGEF